MCGECGNQYDEDIDEEWVRCKGCKQWYHGECLDLSEGASDDKYFVFDSCPLCTANEEPEIEAEEIVEENNEEETDEDNDETGETDETDETDEDEED